MTRDEIIGMVEKMMQKLMKEVKGIDISLPLERMKYDDAMNRFGSDKPDTRFDLELIHASDIFAESEFKVFRGAVDNGGKVALLNVSQQAENFSRKDIDALTDYVKIYGAKGLAWLKLENDELAGPIAKFLSTEEKAALIDRASAKNGDLLLFGADQANIVYDSLGALRISLGLLLVLFVDSKFNFLWLVVWPL